MVVLATQLKLKGGRNNYYGCNQKNCHQNRINKAINEKTIRNTIIHQNYVTGKITSDSPIGLPSNNSSIEPSDQPITV